jgi:hypothetical protein
MDELSQPLLSRPLTVITLRLKSFFPEICQIARMAQISFGVNRRNLRIEVGTDGAASSFSFF